MQMILENLICKVFISNLFKTSKSSDSARLIFTSSVAVTENGRGFNVSWLFGGHPVLDLASLMSEANRYIGILLDLLRSTSSLRGSLTIMVVNW